jgi:hypothetical protein
MEAPVAFGRFDRRADSYIKVILDPAMDWPESERT